MKVDIDAHLSEHQFQVGEQVLLKLHPYAQSTVVSRPCPKLALKYFGPYKVVEKWARWRTNLNYLMLPKFILFSMYPN
jgi:hypothetical protein